MDARALRTDPQPPGKLDAGHAVGVTDGPHPALRWRLKPAFRFQRQQEFCQRQTGPSYLTLHVGLAGKTSLDGAVYERARKIAMRELDRLIGMNTVAMGLSPIGASLPALAAITQYDNSPSGTLDTPASIPTSVTARRGHAGSLGRADSQQRQLFFKHVRRRLPSADLGIGHRKAGPAACQVRLEIQLVPLHSDFDRLNGGSK